MALKFESRQLDNGLHEILLDERRISVVSSPQKAEETISYYRDYYFTVLFEIDFAARRAGGQQK